MCHWVRFFCNMYFSSHIFESFANFPLVRLLNEEEVSSLPFEVVYDGKEETFKSDEKEAMTILVEILLLMNKLQVKDWWSYPLGMEMFKNN